MIIVFDIVVIITAITITVFGILSGLSIGQGIAMSIGWAMIGFATGNIIRLRKKRL